MSVKNAFSTIWDGVKELFRSIVNTIKVIFRKVLNFFEDVVEYFKKLTLNPKKDTPFVIDAGELGARIKDAPRVKTGIFEGVYHEDTNTITDYREIGADEFDDQTNEVMSQAKDGLVTLS